MTNNTQKVEEYNFTNLENFIDNVKRTESVPERIEVNADLYKTVLRMFVSVGNMVDQLKKHSFYGTALDSAKFPKTMNTLIGDLEADMVKLRMLHEQSPERGNLNALPKTHVIGSHEDVRANHATLGVATESVELVERLLHDGDDMVNMIEEMADVLYYIGIGADVARPYMGNNSARPIEGMMEKEINKLRIRFPDKFTQFCAENRNLEAERALLEENVDKKQ